MISLEVVHDRHSQSPVSLPSWGHKASSRAKGEGYVASPPTPQEFIKGNISQSGFCVKFFGLNVKSCPKYGMAREKRKTERKKDAKNDFFRRFFLLNVSAIFPYFFFPAVRAENVAEKRSPENSTKKFSTTR